MIDMIEFEDEPVDDRASELLLGHLVTWGSIVAGLVFAIVLTHFNTAETEENPAPAHAEPAP